MAKSKKESVANTEPDVMPAPAPAPIAPQPPLPWLAGYFPIQPRWVTRPSWHLFRGLVSLCGVQEVAELPAEQLEPEVVAVSGRHYCQACQKLLAMEARKGWPAEPALSLAEKDFIREHWAKHTAKELAQMLGRTIHEKISQWASTYCLHKTRNTGQFRKGAIPQTAKPGVNETVRFDKRQVPYWYVRGGKYGWEYKHVALWVAANGTVPEGQIIVFKDGNTLNCVLENLELITRGENLARNSGRKELTDEYVSRQIARKTGKAGLHLDRELQQQVLQAPELLEVKRNQLRLNRTLKAIAQS
jgi:hypothetical protein